MTLTALRVAACHTGKTTILVCHILLTTLRAATLTTCTISDILLQCALNAILPSVDSLRVEVETVYKLYNLVDRHAVTKYTRDKLCVVPELLVEESRDTTNGVDITVAILILEIITLRGRTQELLIMFVGTEEKK